MKSYCVCNNLLGWLMFLMSTTIYFLTTDPSVSLWDCGEWITVANGLQVGHPPGAPLYILLAKIFSLLSFGNTALVAFCINTLSAVASGLTVMFLFWTTTFFVSQLFQNKAHSSITHPQLVIFGSGIVAALCFTFSDSFWFSATESEVYALSLLFTAIILWCITKWKHSQSHSSRWILLIFFLIGLSYTVHNLSLLVIPTILLVYYYTKHKSSPIKTISAIFAGFILLATILWGIIPYFFKLMSASSLLMVNNFGFSTLSSIIIYFVVLFSVLLGASIISTRFGKVRLQFIFVALFYLILGISVHCSTMFCSMAQPPINEGTPNNPITLEAYINRTQYEKPPIVYGQYHTAPFEKYADAKPQYTLAYIVEHNDNVVDTCFSKTETNKYTTQNNYTIKEKYIITNDGKNIVPIYNKEFYTIFPRMWKYGEDYAQNYYSWTNLSGDFVEINGNQIYKPSFSDNITFFLNYQLNYMYFRYFMWNFSGKHHNINQPFSDRSWTTGIAPLDKLLNNNSITDNEKGEQHNTYFLLPFILGFLGFFFQMYKNTPNNIVLSTLFFCTSIAVVIYLNQAAYEPRERDYVYLPSFYTFAIWIGLGTSTIVYTLQKIKIFRTKTATTLVILILLSIPTLMACQNWNDHNRSKQTLARSLAYNYLQSCAPNAILFTFGDNDTFPLWYMQEVEGIRKDIRIINLSLLGSDWYINQIKNDSSNIVNISFESSKYQGSNLDLTITTATTELLPLSDALNFLSSEDSKWTMDGMPIVQTLPSNVVYITAWDSILQRNKDINIELPQFLNKSNVLHLDIINNNHNNRPIYYTDYAIEEIKPLENYLQLEGFTYRLNLSKRPKYNHINIDVFYNNIMNKFTWGNIDENYFNESTLQILNTQLGNIAKLSNAMKENNDTTRCKNMWQRIMSEIPRNKIYVDIQQ